MERSAGIAKYPRKIKGLVYLMVKGNGLRNVIPK